jgi:hypothetical protein
VSDVIAETVLDCEAGRAMGCASFCCRLIVRLRPGEREPRASDGVHKSCVDKEPESGLCVWFDTPSGHCKVWNERPGICREYDCNDDPLLQVVLREGFSSLVALVHAALPSDGERKRVPHVPRAHASAASKVVS